MHEYIPLDEEISEAEMREVLGQAIMFLNNFNPKNKQNYTWDNPPSIWLLAVQETASRILYEKRAQALANSDAELAGRYRAFVKHHRDISEDLAKGLLQVRPTSRGSRGRR
jgi:hypothetical protein